MLHGLRQSLLHPELIAAFAEEYRRAFNETAADANAERDKAKRDLGKAEKKIANMRAAIRDGFYNSSMKADMATLEEEKARPRPLPRLQPRAASPAAASAHLSGLYRCRTSTGRRTPPWPKR